MSKSKELAETLGFDPSQINLKDYELKNIPEKERREFLAALEIDKPFADQETFDLQEYYSYWLIDEMCVLSDGLFFRLRTKCEEWRANSENINLKNSAQEIYKLLHKLGLIDFPFTNNPSEVLSFIERGYEIHGVRGIRYEAMERANEKLGQHRNWEKMLAIAELMSPSLKDIVGAVFFSGIIKSQREAKQANALKSVEHLIQRYKLFFREINKANGTRLPDGTIFDLKSTVDRFDEFKPSFFTLK